MLPRFLPLFATFPETSNASPAFAVAGGFASFETRRFGFRSFAAVATVAPSTAAAESARRATTDETLQPATCFP